MKKFYYIFIVFVFIITNGLKAQTSIPNGGFENWDNANKPTSWDGSNISVPPIVNYKVIFQEITDPYNGSYSVKLLSKEYSTAGVTRVVPAFITLGKFWFTISPQAGGYKGGIPFTGRPDSVKFYYKSSVAGNDMAHFTFESWKGNHTTLVGGDTTYLPSSTSSWTMMEVPITYHSALNPDSLNIVFSASNLYNENNIADLSTLWIDDVTMVYNSASIIDIDFNNNFFVYADDNHLFVSVEFENPTGFEIKLFNIAGQLMYSNSGQSKKYTDKIKISGLNQGYYFVNVLTDNGRTFNQKVLIK